MRKPRLESARWRDAINAIGLMSLIMNTLLSWPIAGWTGRKSRKEGERWRSDAKQADSECDQRADGWLELNQIISNRRRHRRDYSSISVPNYHCELMKLIGHSLF